MGVGYYSVSHLRALGVWDLDLPLLAILFWNLLAVLLWSLLGDLESEG